MITTGTKFQFQGRDYTVIELIDGNASYDVVAKVQRGTAKKLVTFGFKTENGVTRGRCGSTAGVVTLGDAPKRELNPFYIPSKRTGQRRADAVSKSIVDQILGH